jgi:hypothetical protein
MIRTNRLFAALPLMSLATACSGAGYDENVGTLDESIRNGTIVTPFGPNPAPLYTQAIVDLNGCTGTLVDPYWALSASHCAFAVGNTATSRRPTGNITTTVDRVVTLPSSDMVLLHLSGRMDMPQVSLLGGTTSGIVGNPFESYGYGAMAASGSCSTDDDCPSGSWCGHGSCLTSSADLRVGTLDAVASSSDLYFESWTNAAGQMTLPGDSGGPCFLNGALAGVNSGYYLDLSGSSHGSIPANTTWLNSTLSDAGFVRVTTTSGSSNATSTYSMNTTGGTNVVTWLGTGSARVDFPGLGKVGGGHVQVSAFGTGNERCKVSSWGQSGTKLQAFVKCYTSAGVLKSTQFAVSYLRRAGTPGAEGAYVWADQPTASAYTPPTIRQWNSTGKLNTIQRTGVGIYAVAFPGQTFTGGTVEVTAYGGASEYCKVENWFADIAQQNVNVRCFTTSGNPVDSRFTAKYTRGSPTLASSFGFAWADQPTSSSYQPSSTYQFVSVASECGQLTRGPVTITRNSTGRYTVTFTGLPASSPLRSHVKVTAYGPGSESCKVRSWTGASNSSAEVACYDGSGAAVDARYTISFSSTASITC